MILIPVQSHHHEGSPTSKEEKVRWEGFVEKLGFEPRVKEWRVMDAERGDDDKDELYSNWGNVQVIHGQVSCSTSRVE